MSDAGIRAALDGLPCWGPHPDSNRWAEIEYILTDGSTYLHEGDDLRDALRAGLVIATHFPGDGIDLGDGLTCEWRYQAAIEADAKGEW